MSFSYESAAKPTATVEITGIDSLVATGGTVTLDENYSPYVSASIVVPLTSPDLGESIDPRTPQRVTITVADESLDFLDPRVFDLGIRDRTVDHAQQTITIEAASDEAMLHDTCRLGTTTDRTARGHEASLRGIVGWALAKIGATIDPAGADADMTAQWDATNLLLNGNATADTFGWAVGGGGGTTIAHNAGPGVDVAGFVRATQTSAYGVVFLTEQPSNMSCAPGRMHTASVYVRNNTGTATQTLHLVYYDAENQLTKDVIGSPVVVGAGWVRLDVTGTAPANTSRMSAYVDVTGTATGRTWDLDQAMIVDGPLLMPFFDGDTPDTGNYLYSWDSAVGHSVSLRVATPPRPPDLFDWEPGQSLFDFLRPFLEASGLRLWCDEQRVWVLEPPGATDFSNMVEAFATGEYGDTIGNAAAGQDVISRDRDDWATGVVVRYAWFDENGNRTTRYDSAGTDGKVITVDRATAYPGPGAAAVILDAMSRRGRVQSATITRGFQAAPGYYSRVSLPGTAQQDGRVRRVVLELDTGNAQIATNGTETP